jgi:vacuolar-type H+-ATPase subunit D/Vma8
MYVTPRVDIVEISCDELIQLEQQIQRLQEEVNALKTEREELYMRLHSAIPMNNSSYFDSSSDP